MKLKYLKANNTYKDVNKLKHLFEHAFPLAERPPYNMLMSFAHHEMYAIEDNNTFIGLVDILKYEDTLYIFFLAIKKTFRGNGYGTQILKDIADKYNKDYRIYLMAENPDIDCDNKEERLNRISFYKHNGFTVSDVVVIEFEVNYRILYLTKPVAKEEFIGSMKYLLGEDIFNKYYVHHVR